MVECDYNLVGSVVYNTSLEFPQFYERVDLQDWENGVYMVTLSKNGIPISQEKLLIVK